MAVRRNPSVLQLTVASLVLCAAGCVQSTQHDEAADAAVARRSLRQTAPVYPPATTPEAQKEVLLASKEQFVGVERILPGELYYWTEESSLDVFNGIKVDGAGLVSAIEFFGSEEDYLNQDWFNGELPPSWASLTTLKSVTIIGYSYLQGTLPSSWAALNNLEFLDVYPKGNLTGPLPASWGSKLQKLKYINLSGQQLNGPLPASWAGLTALTSLDLSKNNFTGQLPGSWGALRNLSLLNLNHNKLRGPLPAAWGNLAKGNLKSLGVRNNALSGPLPRWLGNLTKLATLETAQNKFNGVLPTELFTKTRLTSISARDNRNLGGCIPKAVKNIKDEKGRPFTMPLYGAPEFVDDEPQRYPLNAYTLVRGTGPLENTRITGFCTD